ncbi:MAG: VOC family protein [Actinobacteria bacterium]|nr:VOC family protein [Actinomycetota bacterium]
MRFRAITLDARQDELEKTERFWIEGFGYRRARLSGPFVVLSHDLPDWPEIILQRVDEAKSAKSPVHIDIESPNVDADAALLKNLGGHKLRDVFERGRRWLVLGDPAGNELCLVTERDDDLRRPQPVSRSTTRLVNAKPQV